MEREIKARTQAGHQEVRSAQFWTNIGSSQNGPPKIEWSPFG